MATSAAATRADETGKVIFSDSFQGKLAPGWKWVREDPEAWRIGKKGLEVRIQPGNMWGPANDAHNLLLRKAPDATKHTIEVTAAVSHHPTLQYEQADLVWYYDDGHMVKIGEELVDGKLSVVMGREQNDRTRTIAIIPLDSNDVELRLRVQNQNVQGWFKTPKGEWRQAGECDLPVKGRAYVSLQFYQGPADQEHWARVSQVTVRQMD